MGEEIALIEFERDLKGKAFGFIVFVKRLVENQA